MTTKRKRETERQNELQQIIQRNKIEKKEITENITHKREKSQMKKLKNAKNIKKTFRKFQENREFANKFICASRKIAQISQEKHQKQENAKAFAKLKEHTQELRNESENIKKSYKEKTEIIKMINQKNANEAKVLNEEKRKVQTDAFERRIQRTREIIEMEKEFMMSLKERLDTQKFVPREKTPVFETDMVGGASAFIGDYIGMSLGTVESRLISEIISEII